MLRRQNLSVAALAAATLLFESTLTRLLAVAQFYHFAFLVVSLALLGFGASGTLLSVFPRLRAVPLERLFIWAGVGFAAGVGVAYAGVNWLPFDSYSIAWERRQILFFLLYYLALTIPFLISGLGIGGALALTKGKSHLIYAANLLGSALGALLAPLFLSLAGVPGAVLMSALIGIFAALFLLENGDKRACSRSRVGLLSVFSVGLLSFGGLVAVNLGMLSPLGMKISPYKGLSYASQYPGSQQIYGRWNAISRLDVIENAGTRRLPGLSYQYLENPPPQLGLSIDADALQPITLIPPEAFDAAAWMPEALAFSLKPGAEALVLEPGGGLGVLQALAGGAGEVTAVVEDPSIQQAEAQTASEFDIYANADVRTISEPGRVFLHRDAGSYDIVYFPLTDAYRPVTSGAYSLAEDYDLTVEAFEDALDRLSPGGILVVTRWLQSPPSESLRLIATLAEALESQGRISPHEALIAYRGIQTITMLVKPEGWTAEELSAARDFMESRRFDWVWAPGIQLEQVNRFNKLPEPVYFFQVGDLLSSTWREGYYAIYPYNIRPAVDNRPFFFHFFTWEQTPQVLDTLGKTWQPFGGSGYLVLIALLVLVVLLSGLLILLPLALIRRSSHNNEPQSEEDQGYDAEHRNQRPGGECRHQREPHSFHRSAVERLVGRSTSLQLGRLRMRRSTEPQSGDEKGDDAEHRHQKRKTSRIFLYFALLGVAFLFVEIPLIQRWILLLGQPIYAFTTVVGVLLLSSGVGSAMAGAEWLPKRLAFGLLVLLALIVSLMMPLLSDLILGWPLWARQGAAFISLAPLGLLMGLPFPLGLAWLAEREYAPQWTPWAWAINGCASVVASVLAAIVTLSFGFTFVMLLGAGAYAGAWITLNVRTLHAFRR